MPGRNYYKCSNTNIVTTNIVYFIRMFENAGKRFSILTAYIFGVTSCVFKDPTKSTC